MTEKRPKSDQARDREIIVLRAANWSLASIAIKTGVSVSTIQRTLRKHPTPKGAAIGEAITQARKELVEAFKGDERVQALYQEIISDTVSHIKQARDKAAIAVECLDPTDTDTAALALRGLTAHATMTATHCTTLRQFIPELLEKDDSSLPELVIRALTREDVERLREEQRLEHDETMGMDGDSEEATID
jgi:lambda repressor-like predicted transcriptional regulator